MLLKSNFWSQDVLAPNFVDISVEIVAFLFLCIYNGYVLVISYRKEMDTMRTFESKVINEAAVKTKTKTKAESKSNGSKKPLTVIVVLFLLIAAGAGGWFCYTQYNQVSFPGTYVCSGYWDNSDAVLVLNEDGTGSFQQSEIFEPMESNWVQDDVNMIRFGAGDDAMDDNAGWYFKRKGQNLLLTYKDAPDDNGYLFVRQ